jgi:hypothetical protein
MDFTDFIAGASLYKSNQMANRIEELKFMRKMETDLTKREILLEEIDRLIEARKLMHKRLLKLFVYLLLVFPLLFFVIMVSIVYIFGT